MSRKTITKAVKPKKVIKPKSQSKRFIKKPLPSRKQKNSLILTKFTSGHKLLISGIIGALLFVYLPIIIERVQEYYQSQITPPPIVQDYYPTRIQIPAFKLTIPIREATVSGNTWQVFDHEASWLKDTGNLEQGNIIIYAHNKKYLFGRLPELKIGDILQVESKLGTKDYTITQTIDGTPEDIAPLLTNDDQLTLYTCNGWWDSRRYIVIAKPSSEISPQNLKTR